MMVTLGKLLIVIIATFSVNSTNTYKSFEAYNKQTELHVLNLSSKFTKKTLQILPTFTIAKETKDSIHLRKYGNLANDIYKQVLLKKECQKVKSTTYL